MFEGSRQNSMTNAVILSAGQGKRLAPLTDARPKCLVKVGGQPILAWQLRALAAAGIHDVTVVTGFGAGMVETAVRTMDLTRLPECLYNPFYAVADNIGSCWVARERIGADTILLNGDTIIDPRILRRVLDDAVEEITVTIDRKTTYDDDDMKIRRDGLRLTAIGKTLAQPVDGESIGLLRFLGKGGERFGRAMRAALDDQSALRLWYLSIIDQLAQTGNVGTVSIDGLPWIEVDFPRDLPIAEARVSAFDWRSERRGSAGEASLGSPTSPA